MSKKYILEVNHAIGDKVWMVQGSNYDDHMPKVFYGKITSILVTFTGNDEENTPEFGVDFTSGNQQAYHLPKKFYEHDLMTEEEAHKLFDAYSERVNTFKDDYIKRTLEKAKKFVEVYGQ